MTSALEVMGKLDTYAAEMDQLSKALTLTERKLEPLETFWEEYLDDYETTLWEKHTKEGEKLPSESMRERLARKTMPGDSLAQMAVLLAKRKRLQTRIKHLSGAIDAQRSILSALKEEMAATR